MKETLKLIFVLTLICAVSSALLATVYSITKNPIESTLTSRTAQAAATVLPPATAPPTIHKINKETFFVVRKDGAVSGVAVTGHSANGYGGDVVLMVGISADGTLVNFKTLVASETPGVGTEIESDTFRHALQGRPVTTDWRVKQDGGEIDAITAATISSRAALEAIRDAIAKFNRAAPSLTSSRP